MAMETDFSQDRTAVERWIKKKPHDHQARCITSPEALCEPVKSLFFDTIAPEEQLHCLIELPSQGILHPSRAGCFRNMWQMWELTPNWLIALTHRRLLLIRVREGEYPRIHAIPVEDILYLEHGMVLLFSWIEVHWAENGIAREETIYFNSVSEEFLLPLIERLRHLIVCHQAASITQETEQYLVASRWVKGNKWDDRYDRKVLGQLPLKFLNLISYYGLLNDEHVCQMLYRPAQWRYLLGVARVMTAPRMVVLGTDAYLLLAAEDLAAAEGSYGLTLTFLPLKFVQTVRFSRDTGQCFLNIHLEAQKAARDWSFPFPLEMDEAVCDFARQWMGN